LFSALAFFILTINPAVASVVTYEISGSVYHSDLQGSGINDGEIFSGIIRLDNSVIATGSVGFSMYAEAIDTSITVGGVTHSSTGVDATIYTYHPTVDWVGLGQAEVVSNTGYGTNRYLKTNFYTNNVSAGTMDGISLADAVYASLTNNIHEPLLIMNFGFNNAILEVTEVTVSQVPIPAAMWLFGTGLAGLIGVSRKKKQALAV